ncbi:DivIVA domain-containing protein, partial [Kribbia dieselivorans]|uniref:DivIVA domain-containing protein n=1 Tax=Kribbia dieselivorans TaxID=331526 RepID=UPI0012EE75E6
MALTPEDVLNKTFTQTQFRRGYDEREVDDFLDEVVAEMRRLLKQSDGATTQVAAVGNGNEVAGLKARVAELEGQLNKEGTARAEAQRRADEAERRAAEAAKAAP